MNHSRKKSGGGWLAAVKRLAKTRGGSSLVRMDVEDGVELGDLQQVMNFLRQMEELQLSTVIASRRKAAH